MESITPPNPRPQIRQVIVADPAMHTPEIDCFNFISLTSQLPCSYHLPATQGLDSLVGIQSDAIAGIIVLGSACSIYDKHPWQAPFENWLKPHLLAGVPTLAICYGHQMIAHMFGGKVGFVDEDQSKLTGFRTTSISSSGPFKKHSPELCVSHNEEVKTLPDGFKVFAESPKISLDGLHHESLPIWTLQPHPEATMHFLKNQDIPLPDNDAPYLGGHKIIQDFLGFLPA